MRIISSAFFFYILVLSSGILYSYFFETQFIWPITFLLILFISVFFLKKKIFESQKLFIKYSIIFLILFFYFGYFSKTLNIGSIKEGNFIIDLVKSFSAMVITPLFVFKFVNDKESKNYLINFFIFFALLNFIFQVFLYFNPEIFLTISNFSTPSDNDYSNVYFRVGGFFSNPNIASIYYLFVYTLLITQKIKFSSFFKIIIFIGILLTVSRSAFFALLIMLILEISNKNSFIIRLLLFMIFSAFLFFFLNYLNTIDQFERIFLDNSIIRESRLDLWIYSLNKIYENSMILGIGIFEMDNLIHWKGESGIGPHNMFIYIYGSSGILALSFFIYFTLFMCKKYLKDKTDFYFIIILFTGLLFNHDLIKSAVFWLLLSFLFLLKTEKFQNEDITNN